MRQCVSKIILDFMFKLCSVKWKLYRHNLMSVVSLCLLLPPTKMTDDL